MDEKPEGAGTEVAPVETAEEAVIETGDAASGSDANGKGDEEKIAIPRREYLAIKEARENEKKLQERVKQLEADRGQPPPTAPSPEVDQQRAEIEEQEQYLAELKAAAFPPKGVEPNRDAKALYYVHKSALDAEKRQLYRMEMADVPEARRDEVKKYMVERGIGSPAVADQLLQGKRAGTLEAELAALRAEVAELRKPNRQEPKDTRIVGGGVRKPAGGGPEQITTDEYHRRMANNPDKTVADRQAKKFVLID